MFEPSIACLGLVAALAGCMHHGIPTDRSVEAHAAERVADPVERLAIVTYNVQRKPGHEVAAAILRDPAIRDADVIFLEEVHRVNDARCSGACVVGQQLGYHVAYAPGHTQDRGTDGVAILSKYPIRDPEVIELPHYDVHWNDGRRIAMAATIVVGDRPVSLYAVHLENRITVAERRHQMQPVLAHARGKATPVIIAGDFNTSPFTWVGHAVPVLTNEQDDELEALMREAGFQTPTEQSGATSRYLGMKLDAIYTRGFTSRFAATSDGGGISDHIPLRTQLAFSE